MPIVNRTGHIIEQLAQLAACLEQAAQLTEEIIDDVTKNLESTSHLFRPSIAAGKNSGAAPGVIPWVRRRIGGHLFSDF